MKGGRGPAFDPAAMLCADCIAVGLDAPGPADLMRRLGEMLGRAAGLDAPQITEALVQRERVGTTALAGGVAIPHVRMRGAARIVGAFARLKRPLDFAALDGQPVDIVYALVSPEDDGADHLKALAAISRLLRDESLIGKLRGASGAAAAHALLAAGGWSEAA